MELKGKVVIVTGSGRGIGREYAEQFAKKGAKVTVCDIVDCTETEEKIRSIGGEVLSVKTDVTSEKDTVEMAKKTVDRFGRIDVLVNNAAIWGGLKIGPFWELSVEDWDKVMAVNVKGMFLCCKAVFPYMEEQKKGKIINISSISTLLGIPYLLHYTASKGAVIALTKSMAREVGEFNINVNCVAPGLVSNEPSKAQIPTQEFERDTSTKCFKRAQEPSDLVGTVMFLASEESDFVTGQTIVVDGGSFLH